MPVQVHGALISAPCRCVYLTCEVLGLEHEKIAVDLMGGGTRTPEFLKVNPQHTVPALVDGDLILNESRPIATYLCAKYGKDDKLYPKDPATRAKVDCALYFDMGTFYKAAMNDIAYAIAFAPNYGPPPGPEKYERFREVMGWLNDMLKPTGYVAGTDHMTIADISLLASFSTMAATEHFDLSAYPNATAWFEKVKGEVPNYEKLCGEGAAMFGGFFKSVSKK